METMSPNLVLPRAAGAAIERAVLIAPVVVVLGARQTGKTTLLRSLPLLEGRPYMTLDDFDLRAQADAESEAVVARSFSMVLDEVQRARDLLIALQNIERLIRTLPIVSQAMVYGDGRKYITVLITLNDDQILGAASREYLAAQGLAELKNHPRIRQMMADHIEEVNTRLAAHERVRRFRILPDDFTEEAGELTPTLKIKRRDMTRRYQTVLESLYIDPPSPVA